MVEEYYVTEDTLLLVPINKTKTKIYDINGIFTIKKNVFELVDESCQYYGSSYGGRYVGSKKILEMDYKLPIIMDEVKDVVIFPTCSPRSEKCIWICVNNIESYEKNKKNSMVKFTNKYTHDLTVSYNSLENQIMRATMLMMRLKKRKSMPKKIVK